MRSSDDAAVSTSKSSQQSDAMRAGSRNYFALDESENAMDYLRWAERFIVETGRDSRAWKWVTIALHGALYGFAIAGCPQNMTWRPPAGGRVTLEKFIAERLRHGPVFAPEGSKLIGINWAMAICLRQPGRLTPGGRAYELTQEQQRAVKQLIHTYRDNFMHFHVHRLVVPGNELPCIVSDVLDAIQFIACKIPLTRVDHGMQDSVQNVVTACKSMLTAVR